MAPAGEVTIIGAGPSGLSAAIYLQRAGFDPLLMDEKTPGGRLREARWVENYPGFPYGIVGSELADLLYEHLRAVGGSCTRAAVTEISRCEDGRFAITASGQDHRARALLLATGTRPQTVKIDGAGSLEGQRIFYGLSELLDSADQGDRIAVYGGGDAAFDLALNLRCRGHEVGLICRSKVRCLPLLKAKAEEEQITIVEGRSILRATESDRLHLELSEGAINVDRLLIAIGREPCLDLLAPFLRAGSASPGQYTVQNVPGLFLAGDLVAPRMWQVGIAVGSGMTAAMLAERYLREERT